MKIKIIFGKDIRRWHYPENDRYKDLQSFIEKTFNLIDRNEYYLQFEDEEMDKMTISNAEDFEEAFKSAEEEKRPSLKIYVVKGSIEYAYKDSSSLPILSPSPVLSGPIPPSPNFLDRFDMLSDPLCQFASEELLLRQHHQEQEQHQSKTQQQMDHRLKDINWRKMALNFLTDEKVKPLFPEVVRRVVSALREERCTQGEELSIYDVMLKVLQEEKFLPIVVHEFYQTKLKQSLPCLLTKVARYKHVLLNFSEEAIGSWVPNLVNVITTALANEADDGEEEMWDGMGPNLCHYLLPMWFSLMNAHGDNECNEKREAVHTSVQCDKCKMCPIRGVRYKCCVCSDYDLCATCESFGEHNPMHPLVKMSQPIELLRPHECNDFSGMREWYGRWMHMIQSAHGWFPKPFFMENHEWTPHPHSRWHGPRGPHPQHGRGRGGGHCQKWIRFANAMEKAFECQEEQNTMTGDGYCKNKNTNKNNNNSNNASCSNRKTRLMAEFVKDVSLPDRSHYPTDTIMEKTWEMKNTGNVEWGNGVELVFLKGNETLALEKQYPVPNTKPQESVQISAMIRTPGTPGRYCAYFRLQKNGSKFGPRVWVDIFAVEEAKNTKQGEEEKKEKAKEESLSLQKEQSQLQPSLLSSSELPLLVEQNTTQQSSMEPLTEEQKQYKPERGKEKRKQGREDKKQCKLQNRKERLARKLEKIDAKLCCLGGIQTNQSEVVESSNKINCGTSKIRETGQEEMISCMCGAPLIQTTPIAAYYSGAHVNCDICGLYCPSGGGIYHCPAEKTKDHPKGYDLCLNCVRFQVRSFPEQHQQQQQSCQQQYQQQYQPCQQYQQYQQSQQQSQYQHSQHQQQQRQDKAMKEDTETTTLNQEKPKEVAEDEHNPDINMTSDPLEGFEYAVQARNIINMGFRDVQKIKYLLINKKGDSNQVIAELLSR